MPTKQRKPAPKLKDVEELLVACGRRCCLCHRFCSTKIEIAHIVEGSTDPDDLIPLCFDCHSDIGHYSDSHPRGRKFTAQELRRHRNDWIAYWRASKRDEKPVAERSQDTDLLRFYCQCFDRPAFQDIFLHESSISDLSQALGDTILAVNTGCLRSRDGKVIARAKGKAFLRDPSWRDTMTGIVGLLRMAKDTLDGACHSVAQDAACRACKDPRVASLVDDLRSKAIDMLNGLCRVAGVPPLPKLRPRPDWQDLLRNGGTP